MAILLDKSGNTAGAAKFGGSFGIRERTASKFVPSGNWTVSSVDVRINEDTGNPTGDIQILVVGDSGGVPNNSDVKGTATLTAADANVGGTFTSFNRSFAAPFSLISGTTYWLVLKLASGESDSDYYSSRAITTASAGNGAKFDEDGSGVWATNTEDLYYILNGTVASSFTPKVVMF